MLYSTHKSFWTIEPSSVLICFNIRYCMMLYINVTFGWQQSGGRWPCWCGFLNLRIQCPKVLLLPEAHGRLYHWRSVLSKWKRTKYTVYLLYLNVFAKLHSTVGEQLCFFAASMFSISWRGPPDQSQQLGDMCTPHNFSGNTGHLPSNHI